MSKGNYGNINKVKEYLKRKGLEYVELNGGLHLKILGATTAIELWPTKMTYHVLRSEHPVVAGEYRKLDFYFNEEQLDNLLNG